MALTLREFRKKYPQYDDLDDEALAKQLHTRNYGDMDYTTFRSTFFGRTPVSPSTARAADVAQEPVTDGVTDPAEVVTGASIERRPKQGALATAMRFSGLGEGTGTEQVPKLIKRTTARVAGAVPGLGEMLLRDMRTNIGDALGLTPEEQEIAAKLSPTAPLEVGLRKAREVTNDYEKEIVEAMRPDVRRAIEKQLVERDERDKLRVGGGATDPWWWAANLIDVAGMMAPGFVGAGGAARVAYATRVRQEEAFAAALAKTGSRETAHAAATTAANAAASGEAARVAYAARYAQVLSELSSKKMAQSLALKAAEKEALKAAVRAAVIVGGASEGLLAGGMNAQQVEETISQIDEDTMMGYEPYRQLREQGLTHEAARARVATDKGVMVGLSTAIVTGATGAPMNALLGKWFVGERVGTTLGKVLTPVLGKTAGGRVAAGATIAGGEGAQEFVQEGFDQYASNIAEQPITGKPTWEGVLEGAITGGVLGSVVGGGGAIVAGPQGPSIETLGIGDDPEVERRRAALDVARENLQAVIKLASRPGTKVTKVEVDGARKAYREAVVGLARDALQSGKLPADQQAAVAEALRQAEAAETGVPVAEIPGEVRAAPAKPAKAKEGAEPALNETETARLDALNRVATADVIETGALDTLTSEGLARIGPNGRPLLLPAGRRQRTSLSARAATEEAGAKTAPTVAKKAQVAKKQQPVAALKPLEEMTPAEIDKLSPSERRTLGLGPKAEVDVAALKRKKMRLPAERRKAAAFKKQELEQERAARRARVLEKTGTLELGTARPARPARPLTTSLGEKLAALPPARQKKITERAQQLVAEEETRTAIAEGKPLPVATSRKAKAPATPPAAEIAPKAPAYAARPPAKGALSVVGVHFSQLENLTEIDPQDAGMGSAGGERRRFGMGNYGRKGGPYGRRVYFYQQTGPNLPKKEAAVRGQHPYRVRLDNIYDGYADPLDLRQKAGADSSLFEELVSDAGFDGFVTDAGAGFESPVIAVFNVDKKIPVESAAEKPLPVAMSRREELPAGAPLQPLEVGTEMTMPASAILTSQKAFAASTADNETGRPGKTKGPLEVWQLDDGRLLLTDGQHRFAKGIAEGRDQFKVKVVGRGHSDYYATPQPGEEFKGAGELVVVGATAKKGRPLPVAGSFRVTETIGTPIGQPAGAPLLAPNGKPSKLTRAQWEQVRTPEFKAWFGDWEKFAATRSGVWNDVKRKVSKVVDENGEPLVVFHATRKAGFDQFDPGLSFRGTGAVFFTNNESIARTYSGTRAAEVDLTQDAEAVTPGVYSVFLNIRNPNEEYFEGANWDGSRSGQWTVFSTTETDENGKAAHVYSDDGRAFFDSRDEAFSVALQKGGEPAVAEDHYTSTDAVVREAARLRNDGAIMRDVVDNGPVAEVWERSDVFAIFRPEQAKSATQNVGAFNPNDPRLAFSIAPIFYSAAIRAATAAPFTKATGTQWYGAIRNTAGVRQEELDRYDLKDWLGDRKGVTKDEVLDYLRANELQIEEVTLVAPVLTLRPESKYLTPAVRAALQDVMGDPEMDATPHNLWMQLASDSAAYSELMAAFPELVEDERWEETVLLDALLVDGKPAAKQDLLEFDEKQSKATRFADKQMPGGTNYRTIVIKLPVPIEPDIKVERIAPGEYIAVDENGGRIAGGETAAEARENARAVGTPEPRIYRSPHFPDEANVVAHVRFNERTDTNGRSYIFLETVQSDWHQQGRKDGYQGPHETVTVNWTQAPGQFKVPEAPFKTTWPELVLKRMIRYAAENGFDGIGWPTGEQQAERWGVNEKEMEGFYDEILIHAANKIGKKYGAKSGVVTYPTPGNIRGVEATDAFNRGDQEQFRAHGMLLTPELKATALGGFPMFSTGQAAQGISVAEATRAARFVEQELGLGIPIKVFADASRMPGLGYDTLATIHFGMGLQGVYLDAPTGPEVALFADGIASYDEAVEVALHEAVGHMGLRALLGPEYGTTMDLIYASFPTQVMAAARRNQIDLAYPDPAMWLALRRLASEELVAYAAAKVLGPNPKKNSVWTRIIAVVREALRKVGILSKYDRNDIEALIYRSRDFVRRKPAASRVARLIYQREFSAAQTRPDSVAQIPIPEATLEDFTEAGIRGILGKDGWAILTAENPGKRLPPEQNARRNAKLRAILGRKRLPYAPVTGTYDGLENSFIVTGITETQAVRLGRQFEQESVLTRKGLVYMDGRPIVPATDVTLHDTAPENFYTTIPGSDKFFTVELDYNQPAAFSVRSEVAHTIQRVARLVPPEIRAKLNRATAQKLVDMFDALPSAAEMGAVAQAGAVKRGWYRRAAELITDVFGPDAPRFAGLLASLSPRVPVGKNFTHAVAVWTNWVKAGRPTGRKEIVAVMGQSLWNARDKDGEVVGVLPVWINNTVRTLQSAAPETLVLSGPKVSSFAANLRGEVNAVTLDSWMLGFALIDANMSGTLNKAGTDPGMVPGYAGYAARIRQTAKYLTKKTKEVWTPAEVQETIWSWMKTLTELTESYGTFITAVDIIKSGELTDELINATPDFATLFAQAEHQQVLRDAGYGEQLDRISRQQVNQSRVSREAAPPVGADRRRLIAAAKRVDQFVATRRRAAQPLEAAFSVREQDQTQTPEFKKWFGDSKVVDESGKPLVVYHGTGADFDVFETTDPKTGMWRASTAGGQALRVMEVPAIFFTSSPEAAGDFAGYGLGEGPNIVSAYLSLQNPVTIEGKGRTWNYFLDDVQTAYNAGHDGVILHDVTDGVREEITADQYIVFRPEQIKSAIGNRGTFDPNDPRIAFSRLAGHTGNPDLDSFISKIGGPRRSLRQMWQDWTSDLSARAQFELFDDLYGIKRAGDLAGISAADVGFKNAHLARSAAELTTAVIEFGHPVWLRDGIHEVAGIAGNMGFIDLLRPLGNNVNLWAAWMIANRADRLMGEGRENWFTQDEIDAAKQLGQQHPEFAVVAKRYAEFQSKVLDFAEEAGIIDPTARALWEHADYIPFYRIIENGQITGPNAGGPLGRVRNQIRRLRGGRAALGDPLENIARNWHSLIDASLKAHAARSIVDALNGSGLVTRAPQFEFVQALVPRSQIKEFIKNNPTLVATLTAAGLDVNQLPPAAFAGLQKLLAVQAPTGEDIVSVWRGGKREYWHVHDDMLFESLMNVNKAAWGSLMEIFRFPKRLGTATITSTMSFGAANFWRDMWHVFVQGAAGRKTTIIPGLGSAKGLVSQLRMDLDAQEMLAGGGTFVHGYIRGGDMRGAAATIRRSLRKISPSEMVLDSPAKVWRFYRDLLNAAENANRLAMYRRMRKAGASRLESTYEARDTLDFAKHGHSTVVQFLTQSVMFMNARAQGLYRLGRGAGGGKAAALSIAMRGAMYTFATLALLASHYDDERYKALTPAQKATYIHFFDVFREGDHYQLPVPFEVGTIFGTIPEAIFDATITNADEPDRWKQALKMVGFAFAQALSLSPQVQTLTPLFELAADKDFFTGAPILNVGDKGVLPEDQDSPSVSPTYRAMAHAMPDIAPEVLRSPKRLQHLGRGYVGNVQDYVLVATDVLARKLAGEPPQAARTARDIVDIRRFVQTGPARQTKYGNTMYEIAEEADRITKSISRLEKADTDVSWRRIDKLEQKHGPLLEVRRDFMRAVDAVSDLRREQRSVQLDPAMSPTEKRRELDALQDEINAISREVWDLRPGGKLNLLTAAELIDATPDEQDRILKDNDMPATAELLEQMR